MDQLTTHYPNLARPSSLSCFAGTTFNLGPKLITVPHRDTANLANGICMVVALGECDSTKGGHLILHEPKAIFEMSHGGVVLFPSCAITHENIPISDNETRLSITAYMAGSLFAWADYSFTL
jgi:predicted 2-oxoglutarate/Fe(II)-dependent dioxygenase YbiX